VHDVIATTVQNARPAGRFAIPKRLLRAGLPLSVRMALARFLSRRRWIAARNWWAHEMLRDLAESDPNAYHRFLWGHHLGYAETYEVAVRFGADKVHATRRMLFDDLSQCLSSVSVDPKLVTSVFEIGCSLGYNLRFLEQFVFPHAAILEGCDIDAYAVEQGRAYLETIGSRVNVFTADMAALQQRLHGKTYDVTFCAGVLMYLVREDAERVVADILRHTKVVAAFSGLADPDQDNAALTDSRVRERDGTFVHNIDAMVTRAGGRVIQRRWGGSRSVDGNTVYFVFAEPAAGRL
jgi:SAM-dependent methyltransferase